jgi:hypothetical protein
MTEHLLSKEKVLVSFRGNQDTMQFVVESLAAATLRGSSYNTRQQHQQHDDKWNTNLVFFTFPAIPAPWRRFLLKDALSF